MQTGETVEKGFCEIEVEIKNADGLHMRPAMQFVDIANKYQSSIRVSNDQTTADGKSIMQMSMLAALCGSRLKIKSEGVDANEAAEALRELVETRHFDEPTPEEKSRLPRTPPADEVKGQGFEGGPASPEASQGGPVH
jgi:phosphocarrier protein HPr